MDGGPVRGRSRWRRSVVAGAAALVGVAAAGACSGGSSEPASSRPEPVGQAVDLSAPGFHALSDPPLEASTQYGDRLVVPMGAEVALWGGVDADGASAPGRMLDDGALLSMVDGRWTAMPPSPFPEGLYQPAGAWDGHELIVIGTECEGEVPPDTDGSPPSCPKGPAAAGFDPASFSWRRLDPPPIPLHEYHAAPVLGTRVGVGGGGQALFTFGSQADSIAWDRTEESWDLIDEPFLGDEDVRYCADPLSRQVVASSRTQAPITWRVLELGALEWGPPLSSAVGVESILTCGDGLAAISGLAGSGSDLRSQGWLIDVDTGAAEPAFESVGDLRSSWIIGPWLFAETSLTLADLDGQPIPHPVEVRLARGGETIEVDTFDAFRGGTYLPEVGLLFGGVYWSAEPLTVWTAPPELQR